MLVYKNTKAPDDFINFVTEINNIKKWTLNENAGPFSNQTIGGGRNSRYILKTSFKILFDLKIRSFILGVSVTAVVFGAGFWTGVQFSGQ
jgi:hypothetical protein